MKKYIYDKQNGLWYKLVVDYYLPCITTDNKDRPIGIWGQRHFEYIKMHKSAFYTSLLMKGTLTTYLAEIDKRAEEMYFLLVRQLSEKEGITERLKADNQMLWVRRMNNISSAATEIVHNELICK